jgi:two-component system, NtrC family, response regulator AtoC
MQKRILIIDDEENMRHMLTALLRESGYLTEAVPDGGEALERVAENHFDYIFCDVRMPKMDGMMFLQSAGNRLHDTCVIMMSAYGTLDTAVEAMKLGAYDYISKPFKPDEVLLALKKAEERESLKSENMSLKQRIQAIEDTTCFTGMIGKSKVMQTVFDLAAKASQYDTTVLITGDSGTGKELIAKGIHAQSKRSRKQLISVNCAGIPEALLESEMFGYRKGAFTGADRNHKGLFEAAAGGTLFLDEIGDLPLSLQAKLLRVLHDNEIRPVGETMARRVDVRVIAATSKNLKQAVETGAFRGDLFFRLNVLHIHLPALAERVEDIPLLCQFFLERMGQKFEKPVTGISSEAMMQLLGHSWPGNVRELENFIERAVVLADEEMLSLDNFPRMASRQEISRNPGADVKVFSIKAGKEIMEKELIKRALAATGGNRSQAARLLEISHPSLLGKIKSYGL